MQFVVPRALLLRVPITVRVLIGQAQPVPSKSFSTSGGQVDHIVSSPVADIQIPNLNLHEYVWADVNKWSDKIAVECIETGKKFTYEQCLRKSNSVMSFLRKQGLRKGDTVAVVMPNVPEYLIAVLGSLQAGLIVSPINPGYTAEEVKRQLIDSNAKLVFALTDLLVPVRTAVQSIPHANLPIVAIRQQNESIPAGIIKFDEIAETSSDGKWEICNVSDVTLLPYSSGTTGLPKGVALTHRNLVANHMQMGTKEFEFNHDTTESNQDLVPVFLPMYHMYGLGVIGLPLISKGVKLLTIPKFGSKVFYKLLSEYKPNVLYVVPPIVLMLLNNPAITSSHIETVRTFVSAAAPLGAADIQRFREKSQGRSTVVQAYGLSETSPMTHMQCTQLPNCTKLGGSGVPIANTQCKIVALEDPDAEGRLSGRGLEANKSGELLIKGPQVMAGYHNNPEATKRTIFEDGWLRTGDIGHYDEDGHFFITDRLKELIKVKGFQVAPAELEEILRDHPLIGDAAVIGVPDEKSGEVPRAFVVMKAGCSEKLRTEDLQAYVEARVASYKYLTGGVKILESIPKNPSGKILRRKLKEL